MAIDGPQSASFGANIPAGVPLPAPGRRPAAPPGQSAKPPSPIHYPDSDGKPMSDNTKQARWMTVLFGNLSALYCEEIDVFVATDLLWYAREGEPELRMAPDVMVAFGRPKRDRGSYKQWEEAGIPPTLAFEVLSPGNSGSEMVDKYAFYEEYGVEEYYVYDPDRNRLHAFIRRGEVFLHERRVNGFVSPRLGIRFDFSEPEMAVYYPNGRRFLSFEGLEAERLREQLRAEEAERQASELKERFGRLATLARKARLQQASPEELQELERLEGEAASSS